jgi:hypothetical protein
MHDIEEIIPASDALRARREEWERAQLEQLAAHRARKRPITEGEIERDLERRIMAALPLVNARAAQVRASRAAPVPPERAYYPARSMPAPPVEPGRSRREVEEEDGDLVTDLAGHAPPIALHVERAPKPPPPVERKRPDVAERLRLADERKTEQRKEETRRAWAESGEDVDKAAVICGITSATMRVRLERVGITPPKPVKPPRPPAPPKVTAPPKSAPAPTVKVAAPPKPTKASTPKPTSRPSAPLGDGLATIVRAERSERIPKPRSIQRYERAIELARAGKAPLEISIELKVSLLMVKGWFKAAGVALPARAPEPTTEAPAAPELTIPEAVVSELRRLHRDGVPIKILTKIYNYPIAAIIPLLSLAEETRS